MYNVCDVYVMCQQPAVVYVIIYYITIIWRGMHDIYRESRAQWLYTRSDARTMSFKHRPVGAIDEKKKRIIIVFSFLTDKTNKPRTIYMLRRVRKFDPKRLRRRAGVFMYDEKRVS